MLYSETMHPEQSTWRAWAKTLHHLGIQDWAAALLEAAGPLTVLGAQALYLGQPLVETFFPGHQLTELANLLEEPARAQSFVTFLREGTWREPA